MDIQISQYARVVARLARGRPRQGEKVGGEVVTTHKLKTWVGPFQAIWDGVKTYDVRKSDRSFQIDDVLDLREFQPEDPLKLSIEGYSGRRILARVVYMTPGGNWGLPADICVLGIRAGQPGEGHQGVEVAARQR